MSILHTVNKSPFERNSLESCLKFAQSGNAVLLKGGSEAAGTKTSDLPGLLLKAMDAHSPTVDDQLVQDGAFLSGEPLEGLLDGLGLQHRCDEFLDHLRLLVGERHGVVVVELVAGVRRGRRSPRSGRP